METKKRNRKRRKRYRLKPRFFVFLGIIVLLLIVLIVKIAGAFLGSPAVSRHPVETEGLSYEQGTRVMIAAKSYINTEGLTYNDAYYENGYPPKNIGVCTDVVWNGLRGIGVDFKALIDHDTEQNFDAYTEVIASRDPNLDFRLVPVLRVWLDRHAVRETADPGVILAWQPGDIVIYDDQHVAVVSGLRNLFGYPFVIQHGKDPAGDEDRLFNDSGLILTDHYRLPSAITVGGNQ